MGSLLHITIEIRSVMDWYRTLVDNRVSCVKHHPRIVIPFEVGKKVLGTSEVLWL
jgi:hypothetical protein